MTVITIRAIAPNECLFVSRGSAGRFRGIRDGVRALWLGQRTCARGLPRGRVWPSSCRASRSFVLASLRALHLDLRRRRRQDGSDRGMASPALGAGSVLPGRAGRWGAGCGRRVVTGSGSGWSEEPVSGVQSGRAGDTVVPRLPSRAPGASRGAPGVGLQAGEDGVADLSFQRAQGLFRGLALGQFLVVVRAALAVPVADTRRDKKETARLAENSQLAGRFRRWWQVLGSNQRRLSRRFLQCSAPIRAILPLTCVNAAGQHPRHRRCPLYVRAHGHPGGPSRGQPRTPSAEPPDLRKPSRQNSAPPNASSQGERTPRQGRRTTHRRLRQ